MFDDIITVIYFLPINPTFKRLVMHPIKTLN